MDELKNENVTEQAVAEDAVVEQRPSTKYGRTAYQQQMQEEQAAQSQAEPVQEQAQQNNYRYWEGPQNPYQQNGNPQSSERPYQQYQQYQQNSQPQYNAYTAYEEPKPEVKNTLAYVLMVLVALSVILGFVVNVIVSQAYGMGNSLEEVIDATIALSQQPNVLILSTITDILFWITAALLVFDIIQLHKAGKKIGGAIAFAILLRPAYFIWRAHLLGQKKTVPIVYTVIVYMVSFAQYFVLMSASMEMVMRTMY